MGSRILCDTVDPGSMPSFEAMEAGLNYKLTVSPTLMIPTSHGCCKTQNGMGYLLDAHKSITSVVKHTEEGTGKSLGGKGSPSKNNS